MRKENLLLLFLIMIVFLIFLYPSFGWKIRALLTFSGEQSGDYKSLVLENESLKTDLAKSNVFGKQSALYSPSLIQASVYSNYPFNFKNELLVNKGKKENINVGQPVFVSSSSKPILVGKMEEVFENNSLVETVFDSRFQLSVRIGGEGANSLLKGGNNPKLTLIPKDSKISDGDAVYSVSQDYPFGLAIGLARNIKLSSDEFFKEADLETGYNANDLQTIFIDVSYDNVKNPKQ